MTWPKRIVLILAILGFLSVLAGVGGLVGIFWWYGRGLEDLNEEQLKNYEPPQVTRIYARDGTLIGEVYDQRRTLIRYDEIPSHVENAFLAAEDADFYRHEGMDYMGMARALLVNVRARRVKQGASTITQQVVKIFLLSSERSLERKVQELILARRLEQALTKQEILELYLNEIYLGHGRYGIDEAAWYFFGKSVRDIDLGQAALLATLPKAPGRDTPYKNRERAKTRQIYVLEQMVENGFATPAEAQRYIDAPLSVITSDERAKPALGASEFVDEVHRRLKDEYGERLPTLGASVTTTVDLGVQAESWVGLNRSLLELDARQGYGAHARKASKKLLRAASKDGAKKQRVGAAYRAIAIAPDGVELGEDTYAAKVGEHRYVVTVPKGPRFRVADKTVVQQFEPGVVHPVVLRALVDPKLPEGWGRAELIVPESTVAVSDPATGEVLAMIGGSHHARGDFNRVLQAARQPGSSFKPFVYGAAVASKSYTAATIVDDSPEVYADGWAPTNYLRDVYLGEVRLRVAMTKSINTVAIKLLEKVGAPTVHAFAHAAGIRTELPDHRSLALGTTEIKPIEMLAGYTTLARGGNRVTPRFILHIDVPGHDREEPLVEAMQALDRDAVFVLVSMMQSVVRRGTGTKAKKLGRPAAGKTGTSAGFHDAWFCGFTPDKVAVAWVGFDNPYYLGKGETGGNAAIPVWLAAMQAAHDGPPTPFEVPKSIVVERVDSASGLLMPTWDVDYGDGVTRKSFDEYFIKGTEPTKYAVPAELPKGELLLDLYGDADEVSAAEHDPDALLAIENPAVDEPFDGDAAYDPDREPDDGEPEDGEPDDGEPDDGDPDDGEPDDGGSARVESDDGLKRLPRVDE